MRKILDTLYDSAAALAALFMIGLLAMVLVSIAGRQLHFNLPGADAYAGYMMAGAGFLALAHTLKRGEHIRVTLILAHLGPRAHRWIFSVRLVLQSHEFNDMSTGNDATALWIPQLAMAVGTVVLAIAAIDEFVLEWRGRVTVQTGEALRHE
jgi:TRAP-type C4-dicarboxylate transport system permease small subunit